MSTRDLNVADLDELVQLLEDSDLVVGFEPAKIELPGVWVNVTGFQLTLGGLVIKLELIVLSPNTDPRIALEVVQPAFNSLLEALEAVGGPTGDPVTGVWQIGSTASRLPGISVPFDLLTTQEPA